MRPSKTTARTGTKKVSGARAQPTPHQKIAMPKIKPAPRIEFDLEGSASLKNTWIAELLHFYAGLNGPGRPYIRGWNLITCSDVARTGFCG
jgi:hypothetical protein